MEFRAVNPTFQSKVDYNGGGHDEASMLDDLLAGDRGSSSPVRMAMAPSPGGPDDGSVVLGRSGFKSSWFGHHREARAASSCVCWGAAGGDIAPALLASDVLLP